MAPIRMPEAVIAPDVGKSSHWACVATGRRVLLSAPVANRRMTWTRCSAVFDAPRGRRPVTAQHRRPRARRARAAGMSAGGEPCRDSRHGAARLFAGDAKTDERRNGHREDGAGHPRRTHCRSGIRANGRGMRARWPPREELPDLREIPGIEPAAQHPAGIVPPPSRHWVDLSDGSQLRGMASSAGAGRWPTPGPAGGGAHAWAARGKIEAIIQLDGLLDKAGCVRSSPPRTGQ